MRAIGIMLSAISLSGALALAQQPATAAAKDTTTAKESAATKDAAKPASSKGLVYIYRYKQFVGSALEPSVYCDETQLARMDNGRYFIATVDPGKHTFHSNDKQSGLELDVKAGEKYFVRVEIAAGVMKGHGRLVLMSPEQGSYELKSKKLKPLDPGKVVDQARVSLVEARLQMPQFGEK